MLRRNNCPAMVFIVPVWCEGESCALQSNGNSGFIEINILILREINFIRNLVNADLLLRDNAQRKDMAASDGIPEVPGTSKTRVFTCHFPAGQKDGIWERSE